MITTNKKLWFGAVEGGVAYRVKVWRGNDLVGDQGFLAGELTAVETSEGTEHEIPLFNLKALDRAEGTFDFHIYSIDENGVFSEKPFIIEGIEIDFLPPPNVVRGGIR